MHRSSAAVSLLLRSLMDALSVVARSNTGLTGEGRVVDAVVLHADARRR